MTHIPVLLQEVMELLNPQPSGTYIDGTLGEGGHTLEILRRSAPSGRVLGIDTDAQLADVVRQRLRSDGAAEYRFIFAHDSFRNLKKLAKDCGINRVQGMVLDLGISSRMVDDPERGLSFRNDGPLDMRFNPKEGVTAKDLLAATREADLAAIIRDYGEERWAKRIAKNIVARRKEEAFTRTRDLATVVAESIPKKFWRKGLHPATRTFQALRIAVNDELDALREVLPQAVELLAPHGRLAVISFHSLEDRIVKNFFKTESQNCICPPELPECRCTHTPSLALLTKKPLVPTPQELHHNPRSRSAKLRAVEKY